MENFNGLKMENPFILAIIFSLIPTKDKKALSIISQEEAYYQCLANNALNTIQRVAQLIVQSDDYQSKEDYQVTILTKGLFEAFLFILES